MVAVPGQRHDLSTPGTTDDDNLSYRFQPANERAVTIVVPVYNESHRFVRFAEPLVEFTLDQPFGSRLVFVDDGSTDGTPDLIDALQRRSPIVASRVRSLRCPHRGKGGTVRAGLMNARTPLAGFCDLDLSTSLPDFNRLIDRAGKSPTLVIASRHVDAARVTRDQGQLRHVLGRAFNAAVRLTLVPGVVDTQCGAKVAQTALWQTMLQFCAEDGFAWDVELIAVAMRLGISVKEVGVTWRHEGGSTVRVARDGTDMLRALLRIRRRLRSGLRPVPTALTVAPALD
jgi:hypothetical protein